MEEAADFGQILGEMRRFPAAGLLLLSSLVGLLGCSAEPRDPSDESAGAGAAGSAAGSTAGGGAAPGGAPSAGAAQGGSSAGGGSAAGSANTAGSGSGGTTTAVALEPETPDSGLVAADNPRLQFLGRWQRTDPKRPIASWGPVAIKLKFEGTSVGLELEDDMTDLGVEGVGSTYQVSVDGGAFQVFSAAAGSHYDLASGLAEGPHELLLVRRSESKWGKTTFVGFDLAPGMRVFDAGPAPAHKLEVFGDSISAGLANENSGYYTNQSENGYLAFGPVLARKLEAEWRVEARGGGSFYNDYYLPMIPFFDRTFGPNNKENTPASDNPLWSFDDWQPDAFVLALGTNDFSDQYPHIDETAYVTKYQGFLQTLRGHYPSAHLFCLAPFKAGTPWDEARSYIEKAVTALGDAKVYAVNPLANSSDPWLTYPADYVTGDEYHPNVQGHEKIAVRLESIVREKLGW